jgi:hypothetical protein
LTELFHYTCAHRYPSIRRLGLLIPGAQPLLGGAELLWLTDLEVPDRAGLGLTSRSIQCDRTEWRIRVEDPVDVTLWRDVRRDFPFWGVYSLERSDGAQPRHWWVTRRRQQIAEVVHLRGVSDGARLRSAPPEA